MQLEIFLTKAFNPPSLSSLLDTFALSGTERQMYQTVKQYYIIFYTTEI